MLLEQADHGRATGAAVQPEDKRGGVGVLTGREEPIPHVHGALGVQVGVEVARVSGDALGGLADSRVLDVGQGRVGLGALEDIVSDAVALLEVPLVQGLSGGSLGSSQGQAG